MSNASETTDYLARLCEMYGKASATAEALGVTPAAISHYKSGRRGISEAMAVKIRELHDAELLKTPFDPAPPAPEDTPAAPAWTAPDVAEADPAGSDAEDELGIPVDTDALEAAVLASTPDQIYGVDEVAPDPEPFTPASPPVAESEWRETVWLPIHDLLATMAEAPGLAEHARSGLGNFACDASERMARRYGLDKTMHEGHWLADIICLVLYGLAMKKGIEAEQAEQAESDTRPSPGPQEDQAEALDTPDALNTPPDPLQNHPDPEHRWPM